MTRRVVTCSSWREAAADQADEFFSTLFGWAVLIALGVGAMHLWGGQPPAAGSAPAQPAPQEQAQQPSKSAGQEDSISGNSLEPQQNGQIEPEAFSNTASHSCWFTPLENGSFQGEACIIGKRVNANGHTVYDLTDSQGTKKTVVLWSNASAEVIQDGVVQAGTWQTNEKGHIWVNLDGSWFAFQSV